MLEVEGFKLLLDSYYFISNYGRVYNMKTNKYLKPYLTSDGYLRQALRLYGKSRHILVHRLVASLWLDTWDENLTVNHIDANKLNNFYGNLEMVTHKSNMAHAYTNKLIPPRKGELNGRSKLTRVEIEYIRSLPKNLSDSEIAQQFNMSRCQINKIRRSAPGGWI